MDIAGVRQLAATGIDTSNMDVYEFGVYSGNSLATIMAHFNIFAISPRKVFGFDSFEGLPFDGDPANDPGWAKGAINSQNLFKTTDVNEIKRAICGIIGFDNTVLIEGFYEDSLKDDIVATHDMHPACYLNIDCDLYASTICALEFMLRNKLIVKNTIIRYDDWGGTMVLAPEFEAGESKAHKEMMEKYGVKCRQIYKVGYPPHIETIFVVEEI